jgi:DNA invertase Pin-like site-specific DNA recombinase
VAKGKWIAYYRVSTDRQGESGLGLEAQKAAVATYLNGGRWTLLGEYIEIESGKRDDNRPQLAAAMAQCEMTGATLCIAKLDRLSRDAHFLLGLQKSGVEFMCADMPQANKLTIGLLAVVAQHEREQISARTKAALAAAKARGTILGGYKGGPVPDGRLGTVAKRAKADAFAARVRPAIEAMQGKSLNEIAAALTEQGIRTAQGGAWTATAVRRVLAR